MKSIYIFIYIWRKIERNGVLPKDTVVAKFIPPRHSGDERICMAQASACRVVSMSHLGSKGLYRVLNKHNNYPYIYIYVYIFTYIHIYTLEPIYIYTLESIGVYICTYLGKETLTWNKSYFVVMQIYIYINTP
jgi:hypothetical protein